MAKIVTLPVSGLLTDPNTMVAGRRGNLRQADEVIFERPGQAVSRPAIRPHTTIEADAERPRAAYVWGGNPVVNSHDPDNQESWRVENVDGVNDGMGEDTAAPPDFSVAPMQFVEARNNLYYTSSVGIRKLTEYDATSVGCGAGQIPILLGFFGASGGRLGGTSADGFAAAYRFCNVREDANGYIRRSAPTDRIVGATELSVDNDSYALEGRLFFDPGLVVGDIIEMYRTKLTGGGTVEPSEEYYLCDKWVLDSADISAGYIQVEDNLPDENLGHTLYTNPSEGGIQNANEEPPLAHFLANFAECTWFGHTKSRHRLLNTFASLGGTRDGTPADGWHGEEGLCIVIEEGSFTSGATAITGVVDVTGLVPGMAVFVPEEVSLGVLDGLPYENGAFFSADTFITSITGSGPYTININQPTLDASGGAIEVHYVDWLEIERGGVATKFYSGGVTITALYSGEYRFFDPSGLIASDTYEKIQNNVAFSLAYAINKYAQFTDGGFQFRARHLNGEFGVGGGAGRILIETTDLGGPEFTLTSSRPEAFKQALGAGQVSDDLTRPNRVYYSKPLEPEAVPIGNFIPIGSDSHSIQAMVPAGDNLYIFKTDGVYRISGQAPNLWRVERISPDVKLVRGGAACAVDASAVAWTDSGVLMVSEAGVASLSDGRINTALESHHANLEAGSTASAYVQYWPSKNLILVGAPGDDENTSYIYVFNQAPQQWSRWVVGTYCCAYDSMTRELWFSMKTSVWDLRKTVRTESGHDAAHEIDTYTYNGQSGDEFDITVEYADAGFWVPKVGDWLSFTVGEQPAVWCVVVDALDTGDEYVLGLHAEPPEEATCVAYETIVVRLHWHAHQVSPNQAALYREVNPQMVFFRVGEGARTGFRLTAGASNEFCEDGTPVTATADLEEKVVNPSFPTRFGVDRSVARSHHFYPYLECGEPDSTYGCMGVVLDLDASSEKSRR